MDRSVADAATGAVHGFPPTLTSFVGRADDLAAVSGLLDGHRLVTMTGPGGVGKTRLAGEVARRAAGRYADGVWLAKLAPVADPALVPGAVAAALGVPELPGVPVVDALLRVLARQQLLLVLDNCEHVIGAVAELCVTLLAAVDDARILATSREPLRVAGEARYRLSPLPLLPPSGEAVASPGDAVTLFADGARLADPHFALTGDTAPMVARMVRGLDGLPLAIELAAARVDALGVAQLADRLEDRLVLLADGDRLAEDRQRSLAATLDWSYRLLAGPEQRVLRQLSAFPGPFTLEAAEAVAGLRAGPAVLRLVDCSLLAPPQAGLDGRYRYVMLETLRAYGARLAADAGEQAAAVSRLAKYAVSVAEDASAGMQASIGELAAVRLLDAEDATMRQVLAWAEDHDSATALRLAVALCWWWVLRGRLAGQYSLLAELAGRASVGSGEWCAAQSFLGQASLYSADPGAALGHFTSVRDALAGWSPSRVLADCLAGRSVTLLNLGRAAEAVEEGRRCLALSRGIGYPAGEALALAALSMAAGDLGDPGGAVQLARQLGQVPAGIPGVIARTCGTVLVEVLTTAGELTEASRICTERLAHCREVGDLQNLTALLARMTILDLRAGRVGDAAVHLREELQIALRAGIQSQLLNALDCCGHLCAATRRWAEAVTVWAAFAAVLGREGFADVPPDAHRREEPLRKARQLLGPSRASAAEERGTAMNLATAAEYALMLTAPPAQQAGPGQGKLSARERELVTLVAQGRTDGQIAAELHISLRTVSSHLDRIRDKTGCRRRADLTRLALSTCLV